MYLYIHTVTNTTILQLVVIYNIQLHVLALYVGHHKETALDQFQLRK